MVLGGRRARRRIDRHVGQRIQHAGEHHAEPECVRHSLQNGTRAAVQHQSTTATGEQPCRGCRLRRDARRPPVPDDQLQPARAWVRRHTVAAAVPAVREHEHGRVASRVRVQRLRGAAREAILARAVVSGVLYPVEVNGRCVGQRRNGGFRCAAKQPRPRRRVGPVCIRRAESVRLQLDLRVAVRRRSTVAGRRRRSRRSRGMASQRYRDAAGRTAVYAGIGNRQQQYRSVAGPSESSR